MMELHHRPEMKHEATRVENAGQFLAWLHQAAPGERCCYWIGQLAADLDGGGNEIATRLARTALLYSEEGEVHLVQKDLGEVRRKHEKRREYLYLAVKALPSPARPQRDGQFYRRATT